MHDNNVAAQSYDTIAGTFAEYITKCRQALDDLAAASNADAFERSSGFSLPFVYSSSSDSDFQKKEKLRLLIQSEIEAYERLQKELDDIRNMPGAMQNFPGDMAHFLVVRESGRLQKAGAAAQQTQQSRGMVALTGAGDGGLLHRWRKFRPGAMDLSGAPLSGLVFGGVKFDGCIMRQTAFQNTVFLNCSFVNADAEGADFTKASFTMARMNGACFKQCNFSGCTLSFIWVDDKTDFEGATFTDCAATWSGESGSHEEIAKFKGRLS